MTFLRNLAVLTKLLSLFKIYFKAFIDLGV